MCAPSITLITDIILSLPGLISRFLTQGNKFVDYDVNMHPLNLILIIFHLKFLGNYGPTYKLTNYPSH